MASLLGALGGAGRQLGLGGVAGRTTGTSIGRSLFQQALGGFGDGGISGQSAWGTEGVPKWLWFVPPQVRQGYFQMLGIQRQFQEHRLKNVQVLMKIAQDQGDIEALNRYGKLGYGDLWQDIKPGEEKQVKLGEIPAKTQPVRYGGDIGPTRATVEPGQEITMPMEEYAPMLAKEQFKTQKPTLLDEKFLKLMQVNALPDSPQKQQMLQILGVGEDPEKYSLDNLAAQWVKQQVSQGVSLGDALKNAYNLRAKSIEVKLTKQLTPSVVTDVQKELRELYGVHDLLSGIEELYNPAFLTNWGKARAFVSRLFADWGVEVDEKFLGDFSTFKTYAMVQFLLWRKKITGVAGGAAEMEQIAKSTPDVEKNNPIEFMSNLLAVQRINNQAIRRAAWTLLQGLDIPRTRQEYGTQEEWNQAWENFTSKYPLQMFSSEPIARQELQSVKTIKTIQGGLTVTPKRQPKTEEEGITLEKIQSEIRELEKELGIGKD